MQHFVVIAKTTGTIFCTATNVDMLLILFPLVVVGNVVHTDTASWGEEVVVVAVGMGVGESVGSQNSSDMISFSCSSVLNLNVRFLPLMHR